MTGSLLPQTLPTTCAHRYVLFEHHYLPLCWSRCKRWVELTLLRVYAEGMKQCLGLRRIAGLG